MPISLTGISSPARTSGRTGAFEFEPIWECLQAGPLSYCQDPVLGEMHQVVRQRGHRDIRPLLNRPMQPTLRELFRTEPQLGQL